MGKDPYKVVIVGGGVAGLSAAHELAERGFAVEVYERRPYFGGKAASVTIGVDNPNSTGPAGLPGEHGFRFFPGWYRHLPDTMERIPYKDRTVFHNLVSADAGLLVSYDRDPLRTLLRLPTSWQELRTATSFPMELIRLGLTADDLNFFFGKIWEFATSSEERRLQVYDAQTWSAFLEAPKRSTAFRTFLVDAATRNTVAAKPDQASAYTIAKIAVQTFFDMVTPGTPADRVLNGPTNEVWIDPWISYLRGLGVTFVSDAELDGVEFDGPRIAAVRFKFMRHAARLANERVAYISRLLASEGPPPAAAASLEHLLEAPAELPGDWMQAAIASIDAWTIRRMESGANGGAGADPAAVSLLDRLPKERRAAFLRDLKQQAEAVVEKANRASAQPISADHYIFALPVEQIAYYVNRSETMTSHDPSLKNLIRLSGHVEWMAGIQFYLTDVANITRGHIDFLDSEWSLSGILQVQFWDDFDAKKRVASGPASTVKSIFSVDIAAWDRRGHLFRKEAFNCTREEIAAEVWTQIKRSLNRPGKADVVRDDMLLGYNGAQRSRTQFPPKESYYLDDSIVDRFDRKKQALYEKFRSVRFSAEELIRKQDRPKGEAPETAHQSGNRLLFNVEPLLVNRVGTFALRPTAKTAIHNMFLAGDYVRTNTNLATMEAANESARTAVNEILLATGSRERPCDIWPFREPFELLRQLDSSLFKRGQAMQDTYADIPVRLVAGAANTAARLAGKALFKMFGR